MILAHFDSYLFPGTELSRSDDGFVIGSPPYWSCLMNCESSRSKFFMSWVRGRDGWTAWS